MRQGKDLILSDSQTGSGHFACATSCTVSVKSDYIEVAHPTEGGWKRYKPTILSWSASTGHLLASYSNYKYFRSMMESKQAVTVRFYDVELQIFYKGQAYIETLELTGDVRGFAKMKVSLRPSGPLTAAEEHDIDEISAPSTWMQRYLEWNEQTKTVTIADPVEAGEQDTVLFKEIDVSTKMRTRFHIREGRMLVSMNGERTSDVLSNYWNTVLNTNTIIPLYGGSRDVVVGPGKYTVLVNYQTQDGHEEGYYMSSF